MKTIALLLLVFTSSSVVPAQDRVLFTLNPGASLYNSENSMKTIGDKSVGWFPGLSIGYQTERLLGLNLRCEYEYAHSRVRDALEFTVTSPSGLEPLATFPAHLLLSTHSIDLEALYGLNMWLGVAFGPSFAFVTRTLQIVGIPNGESRPGTRDFEDRLASFCVGLNGSFTMGFPAKPEAGTVFFVSSVRLRYLHSLFFDKRGRPLDNYYQSFLNGQMQLGIGYCL